MRLGWRILLVSVTSLVLVTAGGLIGAYVGDATCTPNYDEFFPCMGDTVLGMFVGGLAGVALAVVLGRHLWGRTRAG